jgi:type III secretion protein T
MLDLAAFGEIADAVYGYILAMAVAMPRAMGMALVLPLFTRSGITGILRTGFVLAIALPLLPMALAQIQANGGVGALTMTAVLLKETFIGLLLGLLLGAPFWAAEAAGDIIDFQRGATIGVTIDPSQASESTVTGTLLVLAMLALFLIAGGLRLVVDALYQSYTIWPLFDLAPRLSLASADVLLQLLGKMLWLGFVIAGPVVIAMFLGDVVLGAVSRLAPQLNIFVLSLAVKGAIFAALLPLYARTLTGYLADGLEPLRGVVPMLRQLAP